jgi:hypothetical protein
VGRIARSFRKSFVYNTLRQIINKPPVHPPNCGAGAHLGAACPAACHLVLCKHQYAIDSTYRANREKSEWAIGPLELGIGGLRDV